MKIKSANRLYLDRLEEGELVGTKCPECDEVFAPPRKMCPHCGEDDLEKVELEGKGKIHVFTAIHVSPPHLKEKAPYTVVVVDLNEGPRIMGRLLGVDPNKPEKIESEMEVEMEIIEEKGEKILAFSPTS